MLTWPTAPGPREPYLDVDDRPIAFTLAGSPPAPVEPVTLEQVKAALKIADDSAEDLLLTGWITAARALFEHATERQIITAEWEETIQGTPAFRQIELLRPPLTHVVSVTYDDDAGVAHLIDPADYRVHLSAVADTSSPPALLPIDPYCRPGSIEILSGLWPTTRALKIRRVCGYGATPLDVPPLVHATLYTLVGHFYKYRELTSAEIVRTIPFGADLLMASFKYPAVARRVAAWR